MSAIWGAISLNGAALSSDINTTLRQPYTPYAIDRFEEYKEPTVVFGCGIQYFTPEARYEILPLVSEQYIFTADVILDNREELMERLGMDKYDHTIPDGTILCEMFTRYGDDCLNELLGAYAFAYYDRQNNCLSLVTDAVSNRCLYYRIHDNVLYFSTIIKPIANIADNDVNERWINDFVAFDNLGTITECEETPYADIYKIAPRQMVVCRHGSLQKKIYWHPDTTLLRLENDEAYATQLKALFKKSVECVMRSDEAGLMLSGGLDSTALACYAAPILRDRDKTLHTYTSVPDKDYVSTHSNYYIVDESEDVLKTKAFLEEKGCRLNCQFISLSDVDIWASHTTLIELLEIPYKSLQNMTWFFEGLQMAQRDGLRLLLNGGYGNITISLNVTDSFFYELLRKKKFVSYLKQIYRFGRTLKLGRRGTFSRAVKLAINYYTPNKTEIDDNRLFGESYISHQSLHKYDTVNRFSKIDQINEARARDFDTFRNTIINDPVLSLNGEVKTKFSLLTGVIFRDPTMDKRIIEFCVRLPVDQFTRDGVFRRLVRTYLSSDMPTHVTTSNQRGLQSADLIHNLAKHWEITREDLIRIFQENRCSSIVDCERALADTEGLGRTLENTNVIDILRLGYTAMTLELIRNISSVNGS